MGVLGSHLLDLDLLEGALDNAFERPRSIRVSIYRVANKPATVSRYL